MSKKDREWNDRNWYSTPRDKRWCRAYEQSPEGKAFLKELHEMCMLNLEACLRLGDYTLTEEDWKQLNEWRAEKARQAAETPKK